MSDVKTQDSKCCDKCCCDCEPKAIAKFLRHLAKFFDDSK